MPDTAFQTQYRSEFIAGFEQRQSLVRGTVITEFDIKGNQAVFLVADSGGAVAKTRGSNGLIPARSDNNQQYTALLAEWHDLVKKTGFNIESSQGNQRQIMQDTTMNVINRQVDQDIIAQLVTATQNSGAATTASLDMVMKGKVKLGNNSVPLDGDLFALITPAFHAYLMQTKEFTSGDFVGAKPFAAGTPLENFRWAGVNWIVHPNLPGFGTASEQCFLYHKTAIGHAINVGEMQTAVGYDAEQDYSFCRASAYMGSKLLQNAGVYIWNHDGSRYA